VKPDTDASGAAEVDRDRRRVRLFVALHLAAVGIIYAVAVTVGGRFAGPPMPPITVTMAAPATRAPAPALSAEQSFNAAVLPDWAHRFEIPAPWESR
jgi:hypothetical protein